MKSLEVAFVRLIIIVVSLMNYATLYSWSSRLPTSQPTAPTPSCRGLLVSPIIVEPPVRILNVSWVSYSSGIPSVYVTGGHTATRPSAAFRRILEEAVLISLQNRRSVAECLKKTIDVHKITIIVVLNV